MTVHNVQDYGATGDGTTLDHSPIYDACAAAIDGDVVLFPAGVYRCANLFNTLPIAAGVTVRGEGRGLTTLVRDIPGKAIPFMEAQGSGVVVEDLRFTGCMDANFATMLRFVGDVAHRGIVRRCDFDTEDCGNGGDGDTLHAILTQRCDDIEIGDVTVRNMQIKTGGRRTYVHDIYSTTPHNYALTCVLTSDDDDISGSLLERIRVDGIASQSGGAIAIGTDGDAVAGTAHGVTVRDVIVTGTWERPSLMAPVGILARICRHSANWRFEDITIANEGPAPTNSQGLRIDWSSEGGAFLLGLVVDGLSTEGVERGVLIGGAIANMKLSRILSSSGISILGRHEGVRGLRFAECVPSLSIDATQAPVCTSHGGGHG